MTSFFWLFPECWQGIKWEVWGCFPHHPAPTRIGAVVLNCCLNIVFGFKNSFLFVKTCSFKTRSRKNFAIIPFDGAKIRLFCKGERSDFFVCETKTLRVPDFYKTNLAQMSWQNVRKSLLTCMKGRLRVAGTLGFFYDPSFLFACNSQREFKKQKKIAFPPQQTVFRKIVFSQTRLPPTQGPSLNRFDGKILAENLIFYPLMKPQLARHFCGQLIWDT